MRITATHIEQWAGTRNAQGMLPTLVRKLVSETAKTKALSMPGGDSVGRRGWDGILEIAEGNAWVPVGSSRWEMGCDKDIRRKATADYKKRSEESGIAAAGQDFVFVSPRRWPGKEKWRDEAAKAGQWREIHVIDADDLEAWLDIAPQVALWFGEEIGLNGPGIQPVSSYWEAWRTQAKIPLSIDAISAGRQARIQAFRDALAKVPALLVIEADSTEEAVAFACAQLLALGQADSAACVTSHEGWRYVDANPRLRILVAASPELATTRVAKAGSTLILPLNIGERRDDLSPLAAQAADQRIQLERPDYESFEKALVALGEDEADAARLARSTGRSWSVYRRLHPINPAIAHPAWMKDPSARALTAIVLVGSWDESRPGDVACLTAVTGAEYEHLERDLLRLAAQDDPPVFKIGAVWKAKAPLELLYLYAGHITGEELKRFFATARAVLAKPDPTLDLKPEQRWMGSVYGKVREESGIVIDSIVEALAKLSVFAENTRDQRIAAGVAVLVRELLDDADGERWLSLSGVLRELAEAAPAIFLTAVEKSLKHPDAPVRRLFTENSGDQVFGRSWHVDLLLALEQLAWSSRYLGRVVEILAQLVASPVPKNVSNRPMNSLISVLRPWWPQTTATTDQRLDVLDRLIKQHNEVAWQLLVTSLPKHQMWASANAKPHWRDDDAGAPAPNEGFGEYLVELGARIVAQAQSNPTRIAQLVRDLDTFGGQYREQIMCLVEGAIGFPDEDREIIRDGLRKYLSWHFTYNRDGHKRSREAAERLRPQFDALAPNDLVIRHAWIFHSGWVELPDGRDDDYQKAEELRQELRSKALSEIHESRGWAGIEALIERAASPGLVGLQIASSGLGEAEIAQWAQSRFAVIGHAFHDPVLSGFVHGLPLERRPAFLERACAGLEPGALGAFASAAPCHRPTWAFLEVHGPEAVTAYWAHVQPGVLAVEREDMSYALDQLVAVGRHRTAFMAAHLLAKKPDPKRMLALLESIAAGAEPRAAMPDPWHLGEAIKFIAKEGAATQRQLALLEFPFFNALHYHHGTPHLFAEMLEHPELFVECITLAFRPESQHGKPAEALSAHEQAMATLAGTILHQGRGCPGRREDGSIDRDGFHSWILTARKLAAEKERLRAADTYIGEWLSTCPADADGAWPCAPVRDLLERTDGERIRNGFSVGVRNNRGVHTRAVGAGGIQERELAAKYRAFAAPLQGKYPMTADVLESIAKSYEEDGHWQDNDANLWKEGVK